MIGANVDANALDALYTLEKLPNGITIIHTPGGPPAAATPCEVWLWERCQALERKIAEMSEPVVIVNRVPYVPYDARDGEVAELNGRVMELEASLASCHGATDLLRHG
jgi:hypothetical protein